MRSKLSYPIVLLSLVGFGGLEGASARSVKATEPTKPKQDLPLSISAGQSLAQTGPNGTLMGFGCQYSFRAGTRNAKSKYVLVVKNVRDKSAQIPIDLEDKGEADALVDDWKPQDAPFEGHFEEIVEKTSRRVVSASIDFTLEPSQQP